MRISVKFGIIRIQFEKKVHTGIQIRMNRRISNNRVHEPQKFENGVQCTQDIILEMRIFRGTTIYFCGSAV